MRVTEISEEVANAINEIPESEKTMRVKAEFQFRLNTYLLKLSGETLNKMLNALLRDVERYLY